MLLLQLSILLAAVLLNDRVSVALQLSEHKCREFLQQNTRRTMGAALTLNPEIIVYSAANCSDSVDLIVNGEEVGRGEFPHQALLGYFAKLDENGTKEVTFKCGGSLISERFVLTAAHCGTPQVVRLGEHNLSEEEDEEDFEVERFYKHPNYTLKASYNDIALVKLMSDVEFYNFVRPACLWSNTALNISTVIATGFGATQFIGTGSNVLMKVRLMFMPKASCQERFEFDRRFKRGILEGQLCVGSQKDGKDTCQGDSGGPIQTVTDPKTCMYHIVGVTSLGTSCGAGKAENIYTQVASYLDWIEDMVWPGQRELYEDYDDY
uniref:Putative trypsin-like serine protease n=1 Tax=Culex tarsalis TaxID=7177 RepID=A0A1Q3FMU3_CULTA